MAERRIGVAFSGGRDSTALLHATVAAAIGQGVTVVALHVHHGLSPNADAWLAHAESLCRRWARAGKPVEFAAQRLAGGPPRGESVEAWARDARYAALRAMALERQVGLVLLAHHRLDQAETLLLQALRGGGVAGLAGMPRRAERDGIVWRRPWLAKPRAEIDAYLRRHRLKHIEDESNLDPRFARNRLRLHVWPALAAAFDAAEATLATAADWAQQAAEVLDEVAALDLVAIADPAGLQVKPWLGLSAGRRGNALRAWLNAQGSARAPASLVVRLLEELPSADTARWPFAAGELRLHGGVLRVAPPLTEAPGRGTRETHLCVQRAGRHALPGWQGDLQVDRVREGGVPLAWLAHVELRARSGGERFQAGFDRPARSLKKQYQDAAVPAWERGGPLVYSGGQLVFVPGLGVDARVIGVPGQPMVKMQWLARQRPG